MKIKKEEISSSISVLHKLIRKAEERNNTERVDIYLATIDALYDEIDDIFTTEIEKKPLD